jgi:hypothetical protein
MAHMGAGASMADALRKIAEKRAAARGCARVNGGNASDDDGEAVLVPGDAVATEAFGLSQLYACCVHTVPPFFHPDASEWKKDLGRAWKSALDLALAPGPRSSIAVAPILCAGARGAPVRDASAVAALSAHAWRQSGDGDQEMELYVGVLEDDVADVFIEEALRAGWEADGRE